MRRAKGLHGELEREGHIGGGDEVFVEEAHKFGGGFVMNVPEGEKKRRSAGAKEAALETEKLITGGDEVHAGGAAGKRDVASAEAHLIEIIEIEIAVAEANAREHGVVLAVVAVSGDMEEAGASAARAEEFRGGLFAEIKLGVWKSGGDRLDFAENLRSAVIREAEDEGAAGGGLRLFLADGEDRGAGSVGDGVGIAEIGVAGFEGMKRKKVKRAVRYKDEMFGVEMGSERSDQFGIESFEMALGGLEKRSGELLGVGLTHAELGELKAEKLKEMDDTGVNGDRSDGDGIGSEDGGEEAVAGGVILEESGVSGNSGLNFCEREIGGSFESGVFPLMSGKFAKGAKELVFVR